MKGISDFGRDKGIGFSPLSRVGKSAYKECLAKTAAVSRNAAGEGNEKATRFIRMALKFQLIATAMGQA
jgi:hypothetical protein